MQKIGVDERPGPPPARHRASRGRATTSPSRRRPRTRRTRPSASSPRGRCSRRRCARRTARRWPRTSAASRSGASLRASDRPGEDEVEVAELDCCSGDSEAHADEAPCADRAPSDTPPPRVIDVIAAARRQDPERRPAARARGRGSAAARARTRRGRAAIPRTPIACGVVRRVTGRDATARRSRCRLRLRRRWRRLALELPARVPERTRIRRSAPTKSTTSPWIIRVRLLASSGLKIAGVEVARRRPRRAAPRRGEPRSPMPIAVFRPRSATAIPRKPIVDREIVLDVRRRNSQPRTSIEPPMPANAPGDRHGEEVAPRHADPAVARRVRVVARPRAPRSRASSG